MCFVSVTRVREPIDDVRCTAAVYGVHVRCTLGLYVVGVHHTAYSL
jgi:hypothetical protein